MNEAMKVVDDGLSQPTTERATKFSVTITKRITAPGFLDCVLV